MSAPALVIDGATAASGGMANKLPKSKSSTPPSPWDAEAGGEDGEEEEGEEEEGEEEEEEGEEGGGASRTPTPATQPQSKVPGSATAAPPAPPAPRPSTAQVPNLHIGGGNPDSGGGGKNQSAAALDRFTVVRAHTTHTPPTPPPPGRYAMPALHFFFSLTLEGSHAPLLMTNHR